MDVRTDDALLVAADRDGAAFTASYLRYERAMLGSSCAARITPTWPPI